MVIARSEKKEIMDDFTIQDKPLADALQELSVINRWLGGNAATRRGIRTILNHIPSPGPISVLDVGSGGTDIAKTISSFPQKIKLTALDSNEGACEYARRKFPDITVIHASVMDIRFADQSFDIVHASLVLHHFTEQELQHLLKSLFHVARYGIVVNDLRRSPLAYLGILVLTRAFSRSCMVKHDGPLSVLRGFTRGDIDRWSSFLPPALILIERRWAFRWLVCIRKL